AVELFERLQAVRSDGRVCGIEIEPDRGRTAKALERPGLSLHVGGFEVPVHGDPILVRAFNVLRQYEEADVAGIWGLVQSRLAPAGLFIDGTCDEIGRCATWVALDRDRPLSLSFSVRFGSFELPSEVAERLPKALIHRNVPGEPIHMFLQAIDKAWLEVAPLASFGNRQRWTGMCRLLRDAGWPLQDGPSRWRLGEVTVAWAAVAPKKRSLPGAVSLPGAAGAAVPVAAAACFADCWPDVCKVYAGCGHCSNAEQAETASTAQEG